MRRGSSCQSGPGGGHLPRLLDARVVLAFAQPRDACKGAQAPGRCGQKCHCPSEASTCQEMYTRIASRSSSGGHLENLWIFAFVGLGSPLLHMQVSLCSSHALSACPTCRVCTATHALIARQGEIEKDKEEEETQSGYDATTLHQPQS